MEYSGSPRLVFGVSFLVWSVWMFVSFSLYFAAGNHNLLSSLEFSWTFGTSKNPLSLSRLFVRVCKRKKKLTDYRGDMFYQQRSRRSVRTYFCPTPCDILEL